MVSRHDRHRTFSSYRGVGLQGGTPGIEARRIGFRGRQRGGEMEPDRAPALIFIFSREMDVNSP